MSMHRFLRSLFSAPVLSICLVACHSDQGKVAASPPPHRFHEAPKRFGNVALPYTDTNTAEWKLIGGRLDSFYRRQVAAGFNGSVLIGYKGKVLYERYFGAANREAGIPWNPGSASQLASTSKTFTGAAVLFLYEHKYLNIDSPVNHFVPEWPYQGITVRMLLNHRSGLPDYTHWVLNYRKDSKTPIDNIQLMQMIATHKPPLQFKPNARFTYSNTNYATLARIIEVVTEKRYADFMQEYIFTPLGMKNTFVFDPAKGLPQTATISYKYNWLREPVMFADGVYGDKGIYSTVEDMYRWDQSFYAQKLLSNETMELAYGPCSFEKPGIKNYGLGWRMLCYPDGYKIIYHNGWWHGNNTAFYRFVKDNFTVIVLGNKYNNGIYRQPQAIYEIVNGAAVDASHGSNETMNED
jgi:CubicO group peptidase (beta-lactamase class C family)